MTVGVDVRHARACRSRDGGRCNCTPRFQAHVFDARSGRRLRRTFGTLTAAKLWRQDAQVALRRGTMRVAAAPTLAQAQALIVGMRDGSVLDRGGRPYKPSTTRSYETSLRLYLAPLLGTRRLGELRRRDVQEVVERLRGKGLSASTVTNTLDPLRVICRRAMRDDLIAVDPTEGLELPAVRGRRDRIETPEQAHRLLAALPPEERALVGRAVRGPAARRVGGTALARYRPRCWGDPCRTRMGPVHRTNRGQNRLRPSRRPRRVRRATRVARPQSAHGPRRRRSRIRSHRNAGRPPVDHSGASAQSMARRGRRATHAPRSAPLCDQLFHRGRARLEADQHVGRARRCAPNMEPLRASRTGRRAGGRSASIALPGASDCRANCRARCRRGEYASNHRRVRVPLPGFEAAQRAWLVGVFAGNAGARTAGGPL